MKVNTFEQHKDIYGNISNRLNRKFSDPLIRNALYLMLTTLLGTGAGFFFWMIAAKYYSASDVGIGVALISAMNLITLLSKLGVDVAIIKYLPMAQDKNRIINSCLTIICVTTIILSIIFLLGIDFFSPTLTLVLNSKLLMLSFILFTTSNSLFMIYSNIFVALRNAKYSFFQSIIAITRILLLPLFSFYYIIGLYLSYSISILFACTLGTSFIRKIDNEYNPRIVIEKKDLSVMFHFAFGNYLASIFEGIPSFLLPLIVMNILGPEINAYFYISWAFAMVLLMIPRATALSLFAEGEHNFEKFKTNILLAIKFIIAILVPLIIIYVILGKTILGFLGAAYAKNAYQTLCLFSLASIPYSINIIYVTVKRVNKDISAVIYIYAFIALFTIVFSYVSMPIYGLISVAVSWFIANLIMSAICLIKIFNTRKRTMGVNIES